jgi:hypothetical protein
MWTIRLLYQKKSFFHLELDLKGQAWEIIIIEKECSQVCYRQDRSYQSRSRVCLDMMGCYYRSWEQRNPRNEYIQRTKYVCDGSAFSFSDIVDEYYQYPVSSADGGTWYPPQACKFLKQNHHIHSPVEKSII